MDGWNASKSLFEEVQGSCVWEPIYACLKFVLGCSNSFPEDLVSIWLGGCCCVRFMS